MNQPNITINLGAKSHAIVWDNGALYRADLIGLPKRLQAGRFGFATLCQMVWVMLGAESRAELPEPEDVAKLVDRKAVNEVWTEVLKAYNAGNGTGEPEAKNGSGGSAPSPASNSA